MSKGDRIVDKVSLQRVDRDCHRCHGSGDEGESQCMECLGNGTVCRPHADPDCLECHNPGWEC